MGIHVEIKVEILSGNCRLQVNRTSVKHINQKIILFAISKINFSSPGLAENRVTPSLIDISSPDRKPSRIALTDLLH